MKTNNGFTLIETIIAMALIMIAVFVFTPIFAFSFKQIVDAGIWQNVVISQRADLENQLAGRGDILTSTDHVMYPPVSFTLNLHAAPDDPAINETADIYGKIISDALVNKTNIKSFITDIYANESSETGVKIIVYPKTIYYNEILFGKTFALIGVNLTFTGDLASQLKIYSGLIDVTAYFDITFESAANMIQLKVRNDAPANFYRYAPFKIIYNGKDEAWINVLSPQIIAVTDTGNFITGYNDNGDYKFAKGFGTITSGPVNDIVYNFQKREYIAVGNDNLFSTFGNTLLWVNNNTTGISLANNNHAVSVDWLNNYMIGSSYATADKSKVLLSVKNNNYASKSIYEATTVEGSLYMIEAEWFDFIRSTAYVNSYDADNEFIAEQSSSFDYILAIGYYGVKINDGDTTYYDLLYAIQNNTVDWFDISDSSGTPSNASTSAIKMTGIASGVGRYEQNVSGTVTKSAEYSIFLVCTDKGEIYGVAPENTANSMIVADNTQWEFVEDSPNINTMKSIAFGNNKFIAVGSGANNIIIGTVVTNQSESENINFDINIAWTEKNFTGVIFEEIRFINFIFYAVGRKGDKGIIYSSPDGVTWTEEYLSADNCTITSIAGE